MKKFRLSVFLLEFSLIWMDGNWRKILGERKSLEISLLRKFSNKCFFGQMCETIFLNELVNCEIVWFYLKKMEILQ
jgi:hypothetical protein